MWKAAKVMLSSKKKGSVNASFTNRETEEQKDSTLIENPIQNTKLCTGEKQQQQNKRRDLVQ